MAFRDERGFEVIALAREAREMDRATIEDLGVPGRVLMELAGAGAARLIRERTGGRPGRAVVLCGGGNNGGDGYVIARHLVDAGWSARCLALAHPARLRGDAAANHTLWAQLGGEVRVLAGARISAGAASWIGHADVVVDALFGTGLARPLGGLAARLVEVANARARGLRVAVDLPSGVACDTGAVAGVAFRADLTATFGAAKLGLLLHPGAALAGEVAVVDIAIPRAVAESVGAGWRLADERAVAALLPARPVAGHKGTFGHVGVVGGFAGQEGAALLAARGALRGGAGLVTWTHAKDIASPARPAEVMAHSLASGAPDPRSTVLVVGPGLGTGPDAAQALVACAAAGRPLVLDADALNLVAAGEASAPRGAVLTPHPAEAARLLGVTTAEVQADRPGAARALAERYHATALLKGAVTLITAAGDGPSYLVPIAEPTLATGGTGDVLAGLLGALLAQGLAPIDAAVSAALVHALAGRHAGRGRGRQGALASEIADAVPVVIDQLRAGWL